MGKTVEPFDFNQLTRQESSDRTGQASQELLGRPVSGSAGFAEWFDSLPRVLAGQEVRDLAEAIVAARTANRPVHLAMGASVVKAGLGPVLADLIERGIVTAISVTGAFVVHEFELAATGYTRPNAENTPDGGTFGLSRQTGEAIAAMVEAAHRTSGGLGSAAAAFLATQSLSYARHSVLASCHRYGVPVTIHTAIGTEVVHLHPELDAAKLGAALMHDFRVFTTLAGGLEGGVFLQIGGAAFLPDIFLKALTALHDAERELPQLTYANIDFFNQYRPRIHGVAHSMAAGGRSIDLIGHHEILVPLLAAALVHRLWDPAEDE